MGVQSSTTCRSVHYPPESRSEKALSPIIRQKRGNQRPKAIQLRIPHHPLTRLFIQRGHVLLQGQSLLIRLLLPRPHEQGFRLFYGRTSSVRLQGARRVQFQAKVSSLPADTPPDFPLGIGFSVPTSVQDSGRLVRNPPSRQS